MEKLKYDYLLPLGSVVRVKGMKYEHLIIGYLQPNPAVPEHVFDYVAVSYPAGLVDVRVMVGVDHADIEEVIFRGYDDKKRRALLYVMEAMAQKQNAGKEE